ncbi:MAG: hypothetical protein ABI977_26565 [Acidobacteriota bacterium]
MARRIIRTVDGQTFSDRSNRFEDRKGHVLYKISAFKTIRIQKRSITTDDISGIPASVMIIGVFVLIGILVLASLSLNRTNEKAKALLKNKLTLCGTKCDFTGFFLAFFGK